MREVSVLLFGDGLSSYSSYRAGNLVQEAGRQV